MKGWRKIIIVVAAALLAAQGIILELDGDGGAGEGSDSASEVITRTFTNEDWPVVVVEPEKYEGSRADFYGRIGDVSRSAHDVSFNIHANPRNWLDVTSVVYNDPDFHVAGDDYVRVVGVVRVEEYFGTYPVVVARSVEVLAATATAPMALKQFIPLRTFKGNTTGGDGVSITAIDVEFTDSETHLFVRIENRSSADLSIFRDDVKAFSGSNGYLRGHTNLPFELPAGTNTAETVSFPRMNPNAALRVIFEGWSDDPSIGKHGSVKYELAWKADGSPA